MMKSFIFSQIGHFIKLSKLIKLSDRRFILPFYHTISDKELIHIKHLYPVLSIQRFKKDLDFLLKNYQPVSPSYFKESKLQKNTQNTVFLSFDDGLKEFYEVVAPILLEKGIPAACFINTAFVDNKDIFYRLKASILIEHINLKKLSNAELKIVSDTLSEINIIYKEASDLLKIPYATKELIDRIAHILDVDFSEYLKEHSPYLTSSQIKELIDKGFSIGAHSVTHPFYSSLPEEVQVSETIESMRFLMENFNIEERLFSFPFTDDMIKKSFFEKIKHEIDYSFGTSKLNIDCIPTNFQRIPMEVANSKSAEEIIKSAYFTFIIKRFLKKQIIQRN